MKRSVLITAGVILILLMLGVWLYLFLFGAPTGGGEVADNLGFDLTSRPAVVVEENLITEPGYTVDTDSAQLSQLTTKPVAGFISTLIGSSTAVRYVEQGTGHIYQIDSAGNEEMISRTTIPRVQEAYFSPTGETVVLVSLNGYNRDIIASPINLETKVLSVTNLPTNAQNIAVPSQDEIHYTLETTEGAVGYKSTLAGDITELFRVPFRSISVLWGEDTTWVYNRPAVGLPGYLYEIVNGTYQSTSYSGYQFVATDLGAYLATTAVVGEQLTSQFVTTADGTTYPSSIPILPEKCDYFAGTPLIICGAPLAANVALDDWYKGLIQVEDYIWLVNPTDNQAVLLENLTQTAGRALDISALKVSDNENVILFTNKADGTLWMYLL